MPHLTLEYTSNLSSLDATAAIARLNQVLAASGQFEEEIDIKSRAVRLESFAIGTVTGGRGFAHARLAILSGRSPETRSALSHQLLAALKEVCRSQAGLHTQLCVEIQEIDRSSYAKAVAG